MKLVLALLSLLLITKECDSNKSTEIKSNNAKTVQTQNLDSLKLQDENMVVIYSAFTRGTLKKVTVSKKEVIVENSRAKTPKIILPCSSKDWERISNLISKIDVNNLINLKAPSTKAYSDAALAANLKITLKDNIYSTQDFDHGNPPQEITELVNTLLSFLEKDQ